MATRGYANVQIIGGELFGVGGRGKLFDLGRASLGESAPTMPTPDPSGAGNAPLVIGTTAAAAPDTATTETASGSTMNPRTLLIVAGLLAAIGLFIYLRRRK